jgi:hypothetical protein
MAVVESSKIAATQDAREVSSKDFKLSVEHSNLSFRDQFVDFFMRYDEEEIAQKKMASCSIFCTLIGLENSKHCKSVVKATCALSRCSFTTEEVEQVLAYAVVNLNREYDYVIGLDARQRAHVAVCHIYIAQALIHDDFATIRAFSHQLYKTNDTLPFFERVLTVMQTWKNRIQVSGPSLAHVSKLFVDLGKA